MLFVLIIGCRLNMGHLSFIFALLLIVSVAPTTFGSAIKANDASGEVRKEFTYVIAFDQT